MKTQAFDAQPVAQLALLIGGVFLVADDGMARGLSMDTDLMCSSSQQFGIQQTGVIA